MKFLFELGLEEMPSRYVDITEKNFKSNVENNLKNSRIKFDSIISFSTPRRIAIIVDNISEKQEDLYEEKLGPSIKSAFIDDKPTKALEGFLKANNLKDDEYNIVNTEKGEYIQIVKSEKGKESKELLESIIEKSIKELEFEKTMKWGSNTFRFVRPIKWILALLDNEILDLNVFNIKSSNITRGLRVFSPQNIVINSIDDYEKTLLDNLVIINKDKRKNMLLESINDLNLTDKYVEIDNNLLDEVVNLIEYPYAILCEFDEKYLQLPEQLITITMKTHQRYFPVRFKDGKLSNNFVVIRNANKYSENVKKGNEKVIEPRLADSKFFFDEDLKINLSDNVDKLKIVTFQKDMGSIYEKMQRSKKIAKVLNANDDTIRAIELSKADLVSNVINEKEFTSLQGLMGSIYAKNSGENDIVSKAIFEHYLPRYQSDILPTTKEGSIAAICDKLDTSIGAFCVGLKPTSSKDPYAIRRATQGICLNALNISLDFSYNTLIEKAYEIFANDKAVKNDKALSEYKEYFKQRLENVLLEKYDKDLVLFIINIEDNFKKILEKLDKLSTITTDKLDNLINLLKRMKNITKENINYDILIS